MDLLAPGDRADVDAEPVLRPDAAGEALGEVLGLEADVARGRVLGLGERHLRRLDSRRSGPRLRDERVAVEQEHAAVLLADGERPLERRRQAQRHLRRPADERGEPSRRVAAVRGLQRAAVAAFDRMFSPLSRKPVRSVSMRLALAQINAVVGDLEGNRERILAAVADARSAGADLVLLPELAVTGYPPEDLLLRPGVRARRRASRCTRSRPRARASPRWSARRGSTATSTTPARSARTAR